MSEHLLYNFMIGEKCNVLYHINSYIIAQIHAITTSRPTGWITNACPLGVIGTKTPVKPCWISFCFWVTFSSPNGRFQMLISSILKGSTIEKNTAGPPSSSKQRRTEMEGRASPRNKWITCKWDPFTLEMQVVQWLTRMWRKPSLNSHFTLMTRAIEYPNDKMLDWKLWSINAPVS